MVRVIFGGLIAIILLGLYTYAVLFSISAAQCLGTTGCTTFSDKSVTDGFVQVLTTVGGLVSALVIAELAITDPGKVPQARIFAIDIPQVNQKVTQIISVLYLLVWLGAGLAAFVVGVMQYPKVVQPLTDIGSSWLGLAVAAAYTYFGIKQKEP